MEAGARGYEVTERVKEGMEREGDTGHGLKPSPHWMETNVERMVVNAGADQQKQTASQPALSSLLLKRSQKTKII